MEIAGALWGIVYKDILRRWPIGIVDIVLHLSPFTTIATLYGHQRAWVPMTSTCRIYTAHSTAVDRPVPYTGPALPRGEVIVCKIRL
jgi:hypothetical protein